MGEIAIRAEGLGKSYRINHEAQASYRTLRESLASFAARPFRRGSGSSHETIWALKDVSFEIQRGEAVGIIGRNGAGKSTLLKILSRITRPTVGRAEVHGRSGSLLEVGTGFHSELTGRENIFLNGAILGMSRREIQQHFDEIVAFAETERFLDTPVKRYSSGMYMRLAFAVAAHLQTDILVVDEVLSVGDAAFQQKCLGKMEDVAGQGRTVIFVSHNLGAIRRLCRTSILLDCGRISTLGPTDGVVASYLETGARDTRVDLSAQQNRTGTLPQTFQWAELRDGSGALVQDFSLGDTLTVRFGLRLAVRRRPKFAIFIRGSDGTPVAQVVDEDSGFMMDEATGDLVVAATFRDIRLFPDSYSVSLWVEDRKTQVPWDLARDCLVFRVVDGGLVTRRYLSRSEGLVFLSPGWVVEVGNAQGVTAPRSPETDKSVDVPGVVQISTDSGPVHRGSHRG